MENIRILDIEHFQFNENQKDFYVNTISLHIRDNHSKITKPHKHNSYLTILFTKGNGTHEIDFNIFDVILGSMFLISPGQTHHWNLSEDIEGYIFTHTKDFYDLHYSHNSILKFPFFQSVQNLPYLLLDEIEIKSTTLFFEQLMNEYRQKKIFSHQRIISYIDIMYIDLSRIYLNNHSEEIITFNSYSQRFQELEGLIEKHYLVEKSPSEYAKMMRITPKHLNRIIKSVIGKTTSDVIIERIILEAKRKMLHTSQSFSEIALSLGYDDYPYFSRLFKNKTKISPSDFLKNYQ